MKEETKSKLKKLGKRAGLGLGLVALFLLGVGVGACSARKAVGSSAEDCAPTMAQPRRVAPPLSPSDFPTLDPSEDNLLIGAIGGHYGVQVLDTDYAFSRSQYRDSYMVAHLPNGLYRIDLQTAEDSWFGLWFLCNDSGLNRFQTGLFGQAFQIAKTMVKDSSHDSFYPSDGSFVRYFAVTDSFNNLLVNVEQGLNVKVSLVDASNIPASHDITFPDNYNPLAGFGTASDGLIGQLGGSTSSPFQLDVYFRSGGQIFKRIDYYFLPMQGMEYVSALNSSGTPSVFTGSGFVYASMINYIAYDGTTFLAWRAIFGTKADGTLYLRNFGEWASKQYQTINVFDYTPVYGQSGVAPNLDQIGILELRTSSGVPTPIIGGDSNADVFSLLSTGFTSVAGLLNIQILPFLTLGTLIFVPLVVMVIFAILKVLNK